MSTTVVCPLNTYASSERALPSAFDAAELLDASLELFSAVEDPHMVGRRQEYLHEIGAERRCTGSNAPDIRVSIDSHAPRALGERSAVPQTFMVMATSTQPLMHTGYLGSAGERVAREAVNPTLLIGPHNSTRLCDVERVVVPCDGSALSESVLTIAREWADHLDVDLWVVTCLPRSESQQSGANTKAETNYVRRLAQGLSAQWDVLHGPDTAKAIAHWAGPALIAMTTHGRSGLSRITVGSVTVGVVRWATGPVLVANAHPSEEPNNPSASA